MSLCAFLSITLLQLSCLNICTAGSSNIVMAKPNLMAQSPVPQIPVAQSPVAQSPMAQIPVAQSPVVSITHQAASSAATSSATSNSAASQKPASSSLAKSQAKVATTTNVIIENPTETPENRYKEFVAQATLRIISDVIQIRALKRFVAKSEIAYKNLLKTCAQKAA